MRQQQDEPGRFSICSRQAAVVLQPGPAPQSSRRRQPGGLRKGLAVRTETVYRSVVTPHLKKRALVNIPVMTP
ncbi:hypothetical protein D9E56_23885 [Escherichia coli]|nr:hypothetical protein [Escherichia coli]